MQEDRQAIHIAAANGRAELLISLIDICGIPAHEQTKEVC